MKRPVLILITVILIVVTAGCAESGSSKEQASSYDGILFDTSRVHTIEISMADDDRADQLANPTDKT